MHHPLKLHPDSRCTPVAHIDIEIARLTPGNLMLRYVITGEINALSLPPVAASTRANELWRHTCFEMFIRTPTSDAYYEFNFAPSTQWAVYGFDAYRSGMTAAKEEEVGAPAIDAHLAAGQYELKVSLDLDKLANFDGDGAWALGLSAVIEEKNGGKSYWALTHPPGKPDFHHADCFALQISPDSRS